MFSDLDCEALIERVAWWAELFNPPCVVRAKSLADIAPLVEAGADFVLLDDAVWSDPRGPAAAIADAQARLKGACA
jgi:thiamine-phosphate pyrophosphorylase